MTADAKPISKEDLLTIYGIWRKVGTRALIDAVRFCQHYEPVSPEEAKKS